ncbi:response regulator transcription factor [Streptomyces hiroshimensis]|uniref:DNA-binding response regulator n=1 Tax=Streptomyces hiroshimensis TaxID=66424 RepID=A0ABQ2Y4F3_9ACTN|nr:response regulator transcription factor [Streptomyces hiroshimensis]GGX64229.1 DNA-binding response regulator [Streptomyces hiroshimensis]
MSMRILLCCDKLILGAGMQALLGQHGLDAQTKTSVRSTVAAAKEMTPDAIVVVAPALSIDDTHELAELSRMAKVILLARPDTTPRAFEALRIGVRAVLSLEDPPEELIRMIKTVIEVDAMVAPLTARKALDQLRTEQPPAPAPPPAGALTPREAEVMLLLAQGRSNAEIAEKLSISNTTVRSHVHHVLRKLDAGTRARAVAIAYETGLIGAMERQAQGRL